MMRRLIDLELDLMKSPLLLKSKGSTDMKLRPDWAGRWGPPGRSIYSLMR